MYNYTITDHKFKEGTMQVVVTFSDGTDSVIKAFNIQSKADLDRLIKDEQSRLNALSEFSKTLNKDTYTITEEVVNEPTQAEIDKDAWFRDFARLESLRRLQAAGGAPASWTADAEALALKVQTNAKKAYIANM